MLKNRNEEVKKKENTCAEFVTMITRLLVNSSVHSRLSNT